MVFATPISSTLPSITVRNCSAVRTMLTVCLKTHSKDYKTLASVTSMRKLGQNFQFQKYCPFLPPDLAPALSRCCDILVSLQRMVLSLPDDLLAIVFTLLCTSTDSELEPAWYSRPTRRPLAVTYLLACERVCDQWKRLLWSARMNDMWLRMLRRDFDPSVFHPECRKQYITMFFHSYYSRAARSTINNIYVFSDAAFAACEFNYWWDYTVVFEARQGMDRWWSPQQVGVLEYNVLEYQAVSLFHGPRDDQDHFHRRLTRTDFPERRDVQLQRVPGSSFVPSPGLHGVIYLDRTDGARAVLGRFDSAVINTSAVESDGRTVDSCSPYPHIYRAPMFEQSLVRNIYYGDAEFTLKLLLVTEYEARRPEKGGWLSDIKLELELRFADESDRPLPPNVTSPAAEDAFMKALTDKLQWYR